MAQSLGDVTVMGMSMGLNLIDDIGVTVPQGATVSIPADLALNSRDLWRMISQKVLFRLRSGPYPTEIGQSPSVVSGNALEEQNKMLVEALEIQRVQNAALLDALENQRKAIEALSYKIVSVPNKDNNPDLHADSVHSESPIFVPSTIRPENAETRIEAKKNLSDSDNVNAAVARLRDTKRRAK